MSEPTPYYDADGEMIGWLHTTGDGELVLADLDNETVLAAEDSAGNALDPDDFTIGDDYDAESYEDPQVADLRLEIDTLHERLDRPPPPPVIELPPAPSQEQIIAGWEDDQRDLERAFDRRLTSVERRRLATHAADNAMSLLDAAQDLNDRGRGSGLVDLDDESLTPLQRHQARTQHAAEMLKDAEGRNEDTITGQALPSQDYYDFDRPQDRAQWAADKLAGADVDGLNFDSSDFAEES